MDSDTQTPIQEALARLQTPQIICIAGPSGCGKSALAHALVDHYQSDFIALVSSDRYYQDHTGLSLAERAELNFDTPDAIDHLLLVDHLRQLKAGHPVACPRYDFHRHQRDTQTDRLEPRPLILVEGIMMLAIASVREIADLSIFIDTPLDICLLRRLSRDCLERGRDVESVLRQYLRTVRPMFFEHVAPSKSHAKHVFADGGPSAFQHAYETIDHFITTLLEV